MNPARLTALVATAAAAFAFAPAATASATSHHSAHPHVVGAVFVQTDVANAGSDSISAVADRSGQLRLLDAAAAHTDGGPVDLAASRNGRFIYQLSGATGKIDEYRRSANGSLTSIGSAHTGLGATSGHPLEGIAAS